MNGDFERLHVDAHCIVAVKPPGLLSVPGLGANGNDCLSARVQAEFGDARVVHRLDMATSGLMLFARGAAAQRELNRQFAAREITKRYVAVVQGHVAANVGAIDLRLSADWPNRPRQKVDPASGKPSLTRYRVTARDPLPDASRLELEPVTGRAHQLRVHLHAIGHPILGDALYGPPETCARSDRLLLHASALGFMHPGAPSWLTFESPPCF